VLVLVILTFDTLIKVGKQLQQAVHSVVLSGARLASIGPVNLRDGRKQWVVARIESTWMQSYLVLQSCQFMMHLQCRLIPVSS